MSRPLCACQGVLGIKVKIQLPHDPTGQQGIATKLPDVVTFLEPKDDDRFGKIAAPYAQNFEAAPSAAPQQQVQQPGTAQPQEQSAQQIPQQATQQ